MTMAGTWAPFLRGTAPTLRCEARGRRQQGAWARGLWARWVAAGLLCVNGGGAGLHSCAMITN